MDWREGLKSFLPKRGVYKGYYITTTIRTMIEVSQSTIFEKVTNVRDTLRKYKDYDELFAPPEENPLERDLEAFCGKLHALIENQYQGMKETIQSEYSRENIPKYVELLSHNLEYVRRRFDSGMVVEDGRVYAGLLEIVRAFLEYHLYDLSDGNLFLILMDQFPDAQSWAKEYVRNYAIVVTHSIIQGPILIAPASISP